MREITNINPQEGDCFSFKGVHCGDPENYKKHWPQYVVELSNVYIVDRGVILDENFKYIKECNYQYAFWNNLYNSNLRPDTLKQYLDSNFDFGKTKPKRHEERGVIEGEVPITECLKEGVNYIYGVHYFGWYPFGHFHDLLQPIEKLGKINIESPNLLLSGVNWGSIKELDRQLSLFGFSDKNITKVKANWHGTNKESCIFVPKLFYLSPSAYFSQLSISGLEFIKKAYSKIVTPKYPEGLKLYLSRGKAKNRKVTNNQEVEDFLKKHGFIIIDGSESLDKDIELFRNAEVIIAPHGSLIRNMIHSNQSLKVMEFCPQDRKDFNFKHLGELMGIDYTWISVPCDNKFNIEIDLNKIKKFIKNE